MFSVIIPLYNYERYIVDAVRSVQAQTFAQWELVICDDGSTDRSGQVADELAAADSRIRVIHQRNGGLPVARNTAIAAARYEWVALLDADDMFLPNALQDHAATIARTPDCEFTHGFYHRMGPDGSITTRDGEHQDRPTGPAELFNRMYLNPSCCCFNRSVIARHGDFDPRLPHQEDHDYFLRIGRDTAYVPVGRPVTIRRRHGSNMSTQSGRMRMTEAGVLERFVTSYGGDKFITPEQRRRRLAQVYYSAGKNYARQGYYHQAYDALSRSMRLVPAFKTVVFLATVIPWQWRKASDSRPLPPMEPRIVGTYPHSVRRTSLANA